MLQQLSRRSFSFAAAAVLLLATPPDAGAAGSRVAVPLGALAGMHPAGTPDPRVLFHVAIELQPRGDLDALAHQMSDPGSAAHRAPLSKEAFVERFGRVQDNRAVGQMLRAAGASDVEVAGDGLVSGAILTLPQAQRLFGTHWQRWSDGTRSALAPAGPLVLPIAGVRAVSGTVVATTPRLADTRASFTYFRGDWYEPTRFRAMTDAVDGGGTGQTIVVVEDASDHFDLKDVAAFLAAAGAPPGASARNVTERSFAFKAPSSECGRDDRGQEPALDVDGAITMAPLAQVIADYDDVCSGGNDGTVALARALDLDPTVIVFPFVVGPQDGADEARYGPTPLPQLEAIVRGIPLVVPAGDDGAYGYKENGIDRPRVAWPCVSDLVICAGGTQLGDRDGVTDEGPWNDGVHAGGGGVSTDPRPAWQDAPGDFVFSTSYVHNRIVPDVSADAAGHLRVYWHGYGLGGVGGTSESAALVGGELAAIDSLVAPQRRLLTAGDLYMLAKAAPAAFRDVTRENDRGWIDNDLRPRRPPLPKNFKGIIPPPPTVVKGCGALQNEGCSVRPGFDAVTGIGSLKERAAVEALR